MWCSFELVLTLGVILYITIIYYILYIYYYTIHIITIIIYYTYYIYYTLLFLLSSLSLSFPSIFCSSSLSPLLSHPLLPPILFRSRNTCRYLHILTYTLPAFQTIRPRMFYRSGWLRCVGLISVVFV